MRAAWMDDDCCRAVLSAMMPANRLALEVSDATGLRIDDVLSIKTELVERTNRPYVCDSKTGKTHRIYLPNELRERMLRQAGKVWIWPGRLQPNVKHRTRQAVYKDMLQAVAVYKRNGTLERAASISPHTMRKRAAVRAYHRGGLEAASDLLVHSDGDGIITMIYALADTPDLLPRTRRKRKPGQKNKAAACATAGKKAKKNGSKDNRKQGKKRAVARTGKH